jgi:uncharacterized protein YidB (DUF937 family)
MALFDGILGNALGGLLGGSGPGSTGGQSALVAMALQMIQQQGGLPGLLDKFRQAGLGQHADSWVSTGSNLPVTGDQVAQALGPDTLSQLGSQLGIDPATVGTHLSQMLPSLVNQMTPDGTVPADHHDILADGLQAILRGR